MATTITTSLVVEFRQGTGGNNSILTAEIDGFETSEGGLNDGNTSFSPGDEPNYLIYKSSDVTILSQRTSLVPVGGFVSLGTRLVNVEDTLTFQDTKEANLSRPAVSTPTVKFLGNSLGTITTNSIFTKIITQNSGVAVAKVTYQTLAEQYRIVGVPTILNGETEFRVIVFILGETP